MRVVQALEAAANVLETMLSKTYFLTRLAMAQLRGPSSHEADAFRRSHLLLFHAHVQEAARRGTRDSSPMSQCNI